MMDWKKIRVYPDCRVEKVIEVIDRGGVRGVIVTDEQGKLLGTVTDGDIRRGIIKGVKLEEKVGTIMNVSPITLTTAEEKNAQKLMNEKLILQIPIVDTQGYVTKVVIHSSVLESEQLENAVVIMAGGLGSRLGELTKSTPKPLLEVGKKPILETIIEGLKEHGLRNIYLSVNYKSSHIQSYFEDGAKWGVNIKYLNEKKKLGTAGSLSLITEKIKEPVVVMNGDLLTKINYVELLEYHRQNEALGTMCVREYDFQVPYGVVEMDDLHIKGLKEKPIHSFFVNAGVYVLEPSVIESIPNDEYIDMTTVFNNLISKEQRTSAFPVREYWIDIGQLDDFKRANVEFNEYF